MYFEGVMDEQLGNIMRLRRSAGTVALCENFTKCGWVTKPAEVFVDFEFSVLIIIKKMKQRREKNRKESE